MLIRALLHLLLTGTPTVRRRSPPAARVSHAVRLSLAPDRLRPLRGVVWIATTPDLPDLPVPRRRA